MRTKLSHFLLYEPSLADSCRNQVMTASYLDCFLPRTSRKAEYAMLPKQNANVSKTSRHVERPIGQTNEMTYRETCSFRTSHVYCL